MTMLVYLVGLAIAALIWLLHIRTAKKAEAAASWPTVAGTVESSAVREKTETDADGDSETAWYPEVAYAWTVKGQRYTGRRIQFGETPRFLRESAAQAVCDRYRAGASVPVRYDPSNPAEAVLETKKPSPFKAIFFTVVVLILTVIIGSVFGGM
jgi:hypothetical protein